MTKFITCDRCGETESALLCFVRMTMFTPPYRLDIDLCRWCSTIVANDVVASIASWGPKKAEKVEK